MLVVGCCWPGCMARRYLYCRVWLRVTEIPAEVSSWEDDGRERDGWREGRKWDGLLAKPSPLLLLSSLASLRFSTFYTCRIRPQFPQPRPGPRTVFRWTEFGERAEAMESRPPLPLPLPPFPHKSQAFPFQARRPGPCQALALIYPPAPVFGDGTRDALSTAPR